MALLRLDALAREVWSDPCADLGRDFSALLDGKRRVRVVTVLYRTAVVEWHGTRHLARHRRLTVEREEVPVLRGLSPVDPEMVEPTVQDGARRLMPHARGNRL